MDFHSKIKSRNFLRFRDSLRARAKISVTTYLAVCLQQSKLLQSDMVESQLCCEQRKFRDVQYTLD